MKLIGLLDSPYVRRTAICLDLLGLHYQHVPLSVFRNYADFAQYNPVVKAPTLVLEDGTALMDSNLILDFVQGLPAAARRLWPDDPAARARAFALTGIALAACEKAVQIIYEHALRPEEKWHAPWIDRVTVQLDEACGRLEGEVARSTLETAVESWGVVEVTVAVAWQFIVAMVKHIDITRYPVLSAFSAEMERHPLFVARPGA
jgi:glutathione S-transferase